LEEFLLDQTLGDQPFMFTTAFTSMESYSSISF